MPHSSVSLTFSTWKRHSISSPSMAIAVPTASRGPLASTSRATIPGVGGWGAAALSEVVGGWLEVPVPGGRTSGCVISTSMSRGASELPGAVSPMLGRSPATAGPAAAAAPSSEDVAVSRGASTMKPAKTTAAATAMSTVRPTPSPSDVIKPHYGTWLRAHFTLHRAGGRPAPMAIPAR